MLTAIQREGLQEHALKLKESFGKFYNEMIGELRVGGGTGYLGIYDTCAIETEEEGHNAAGHTRAMAMEVAIRSLNSSIAPLGCGIDDFTGRDENSHWLKVTEEFFGRRAEIIKFFADESTIRSEGHLLSKFELAEKSHENFDKAIVGCIFDAAKIMENLPAGERMMKIWRENLGVKVAECRPLAEAVAAKGSCL